MAVGQFGDDGRCRTRLRSRQQIEQPAVVELQRPDHETEALADDQFQRLFDPVHETERVSVGERNGGRIARSAGTGAQLFICGYSSRSLSLSSDTRCVHHFVTAWSHSTDKYGKGLAAFR